MSVYIKQFGGYIADNPNIEFARCDGAVFSYDEVNTASMTNNSETLQITGGQGNFPLAILDTTKTLEFTFASSEFTMDMFAMANAVDTRKKEDYAVLTSKRFEVKNDLSIRISDSVEEDSVYISGIDADKYTVSYLGEGSDTAVATAKTAMETAYTAYTTAVSTYTAAVAAYENASDDEKAAKLTAKNNAKTAMDNAEVAYAEKQAAYNTIVDREQDGGCKIQFASGSVDAGTTVRVAYKRVLEEANVVTVLTKGTTAKGSLTATWPVQQNRPIAA